MSNSIETYIFFCLLDERKEQITKNTNSKSADSFLHGLPFESPVAYLKIETKHKNSIKIQNIWFSFKFNATSSNQVIYNICSIRIEIYYCLINLQQYKN